MEDLLSWKEFTKVEMRIGTVIEASRFKEARKPAYKMKVDFGEFGIRKTSAQLTRLYSAEELIGKQVVGVLNFPPKQIATLWSECLILGGLEVENTVILLQPERKVRNGLRIG